MTESASKTDIFTAMKSQPCCSLALTDDLSAKHSHLKTHSYLKTLVNAKKNCHLSDEFKVGLNDHKGLF